MGKNTGNGFCYTSLLDVKFSETIKDSFNSK